MKNRLLLSTSTSKASASRMPRLLGNPREVEEEEKEARAESSWLSMNKSLLGLELSEVTRTG
jgi:hypothetical protein